MTIRIFPEPADYTDLDFVSVFERLKELFKSLYPTIDLDNEAEETGLLLGAFAHMADKLAYLINRLARESRILTSVQRRLLLGLVKLLGYRPPGASAAQVYLLFSLGVVHGEDVLVPAGTVVKTKEGAGAVRFRTLEDAVILAGATSVLVLAEHSEAQADPFISNDRANQEFRLNRSPYVDGSAHPTTAAGEWTEVRNFLASKATDRHFVSLIDAQDRCTLRFGDGKNGAIPSGPIDVPYKTGGGAAGKLPQGSLTVLDQPLFDVSGISVPVTVTNPERTNGGEDRQSNAMIKLLAPESIRTPASTVARDDYEVVARQVPGVARVLALAKRQDPSIDLNTMMVWVVPTDGGTASDALITEVAKKFGDEVYVGGAALPTRFPRGSYPKETTVQVRVRAASYFDVDVLAKLYIASGYTKATCKASVLAALAAFFAVMVDIRDLDPTSEDTGLVPNPLINFGWAMKDANDEPAPELAGSDILNAIRDAPGVRKVDLSQGSFLLNGQQTDPVMELRQFPRLGTVTLIDAADGTVM